MKVNIMQQNFCAALRTKDRCPDIRPPTTLQCFYSYCIISQANYSIFVSFLFSRLLFQPFCGYFSDFVITLRYSPFLFAFVQIRERRNEARQEGKNTDERDVKMINNLARFCLHSWATSKWNATSRARAHPCCRVHHMTSHHHHGRKNWNELMDNEKSSITRLQQLG